MKSRRVLWMLGLTVIVVIGWTMPALGQTKAEVDRKALEAIVDEVISDCGIKAGLKDSESEAVQRTAAVAVMKEAYFSKYKGDLVEEMLAAGIEPKTYRVVYHLNSRFFEAVRPQALAQR